MCVGATSELFCIVHEYLSATTNSADVVSSLCAPPLLHPSLTLSCAHSLPLTVIDTGKHTDEVKLNEKREDWDVESNSSPFGLHTCSLSVCVEDSTAFQIIWGYQPWTHCLFFSTFPVAITLYRSPKPPLHTPTVYTQRLSTFTLPKASFKQSTQLIDVSLFLDLPLLRTYSIFSQFLYSVSTGKSIYSYKLTFSTVNVHRKTDNTNQWGARCRIALSRFLSQIRFAHFNHSLSSCCGVEFMSATGVFLRLHALCFKRIVLILSPQFTVGCSFTFTLISVSMYHYRTVNNAPRGWRTIKNVTK